MTTLQTSRLTLTPVTTADFEDMVSLWSDEVFTHHITGRALSEEEVWFRCLRDIGHWQAKAYGNWTIRDRTTKAYVGSVGVLDYRRELSPDFDAPEVGWGLAPAFQGQGFASEALSAALTWADTHRAEPHTLCMIAPGNLASIKLAQRSGYRPYAETTYKGSPVTLYQRPRSNAG